MKINILYITFALGILLFSSQCKKNEHKNKPLTTEEKIAKLKLKKEQFKSFFNYQINKNEPIIGVWKATENSLESTIRKKFFPTIKASKDAVPKEILLQRLKETQIYLKITKDKKISFRTFAYNGLTVADKGKWKLFKKISPNESRYLAILSKMGIKKNAQYKVRLILKKINNIYYLYYEDINGKLTFTREKEDPKKLAFKYWDRQEAFVPVIEY